MKHTEILRKISEKAARKASKDLEKLTDREIVLMISTVDVKGLSKLSPTLKRDAVVTGIYVPISGQISGSALLVVPNEDSFLLSDIIVGRKAGTTKHLTKLDESALEEVGNIIACSYITVLGNYLQAEMIEHPPVFQKAMFGALLEQSITNFAQKAEKAFLVELKFAFKNVTITGYLILLFSAEEIEAILTSLDK
jgi:chemotaxis protein CheC